MFDTKHRISDSISIRRFPRAGSLLAAVGISFTLSVLAAGSASAATIFGSGAQTEAAPGVVDTTDYELGTVFQSSIAGDITALRIYLGPIEGASPGAIVGRLWDGSGNLLASAAFTTLAVGWNEVSLSTPVPISAGVAYVVSANTNARTNGTGSYAFNRGPLGDGFFAGGYTNGPLTATGGVFSETVAALPTSNYPTTNGGSSYFRDVTFEPVSVPVPEPSTTLLVNLGLAAFSISARRRRGVSNCTSP